MAAREGVGNWKVNPQSFKGVDHLLPLEGSISFHDLQLLLERRYQAGYKGPIKEKSYRVARRAQQVLERLRDSLQDGPSLRWKYCANIKPNGINNPNGGGWLSRDGIELICSVTKVEELEWRTGLKPKLRKKDLELLQEVVGTYVKSRDEILTEENQI